MTLADLAAAHGVATHYDDQGGEQVDVADEAVVAVLGALGVDATTGDAIAAGLEQVALRPWDSVLPPSLVVRDQPVSVRVVLPTGDAARLELTLEDGTQLPVEASACVVETRDGKDLREVVLPELPLGWHELHCSGSRCVVVVVPTRVPAVTGRAWGWQVQLYGLRSASSWGIGDYGDLATVLAASAADGAGALLVNPLHAETPVLPIQPSPYSPSSRVWRSVLALRIEDVQEYVDAPPELRAQVDAMRPDTDPERVHRDEVWTAKLAALDLLWPRHRTGALAGFRAERTGLEQHATFCALAEVYGLPWQEWPAELRRPTGPGVDAARLAHEARIDFWCWTQLLVDEQLAGLGADMSVGVVHDLAVGVDGSGSDSWVLQDVLALGATAGAPPDQFNQKGQDWGLPPWHPDRLVEAGYLPYREMVRGVLRHAGGLRMDHVLGLSRLWWVPKGESADKGTYVAYDLQALLGILALEAQRAGAVVVGEDLGTVEDSLRDALDATGVLGSAVLWFEQEDDVFTPPAEWRADVLASVTTHDLPTAAGWFSLEQVQVRSDLDLLAGSVEKERAAAVAERDRLLELLDKTGLLAEAGGDPVLAAHLALVASPAKIVLASYGDAVGDLRQPNLPGTVDEWPNWRLPLADADGTPLSLEQVLEHPGVRRLTAALRRVG